MRIGILEESYLTGGVHTIIANQINYWPKQADFVLIVNQHNKANEDFFKKKINKPIQFVTIPFLTMTEKIQALPLLIPRCVIKAVFYYGRYLHGFVTYVKLMRYIRSLNLDALYIHNGGYPGGALARFGAIAANQAGIAYINTFIHNIAVKPSFFQWPMEYLMDRLLDRATRLHCVSLAVKKSLQNNRYFKQSVGVIYNGIPCDTQWIPSPVPSNVMLKLKALASSHKIILTLSTLEERKGHVHLLMALHLLRSSMKLTNVLYVIAGEGSAKDKARLMQCIQQLKLEDCVIWAGYIENPPELFQYVNVLAFPSTQFESFGLSVVEAALHGVPVVVSEIPGVDETLNNGHSCIFVPPRSPSAIAEAIFFLLNNPSIVEAMKKNAQALVKQKFDVNRMCKQYAALID